MNVYRKTWPTFAAAALLIPMLSITACDSDPVTQTDTSIADTGTDDTGVADTAVDDTAIADTASDDTGGDDAVVPDDTGVADTHIGPTNACTYHYDDMASYLTSLKIAALDDGDDNCCFDYDGDNAMDNQLGTLLKSIQALPQINRNINDVLADNVADGTVTVLMELPGLSDVTANSNVTLNGFYGVDADGDLTNNATGESAFFGRRSSFVDDTLQPIISFPGSRIAGGKVSAGPGVFHLVIPLVNGLKIDADINEARIEGDIALDANGGFAISNGKLGGVLHQDALFSAINDFFMGSCGCLDTGGVDVLRKEASGDWACVPSGQVDASACGSEGVEGNCSAMVGACGVALLLVSPDIDTDDNGDADSLSLGFFFDTIGAEITSTDPADCE